MIDPDTYLIEADLSRADVRVIHRLGVGVRVVEFGAGGSTLMFALMGVRSIVSFETSDRWMSLTRKRLKIAGYDPSVVRRAGRKPPIALPKADLYFIDGRRDLRPLWIQHAVEKALSPIIAIHDSRRDMGDLSFLFRPPAVQHLDRIDMHPLDSNLMVIYLRENPVRWENWNLTEKEGRAPHLHQQDRLR